jgi:hypothetical protein
VQASSRVNAGIPNLAESSLFIAPVAVSVLQAFSNSLLAALNRRAVTLLEALGGFSNLVMTLMAGNAAFDSHKLNSQLFLKSFGLLASYSFGAGKFALATLTLFLEQVIARSPATQNLTSLGDGKTLFGPTVGL